MIALFNNPHFNESRPISSKLFCTPSPQLRLWRPESGSGPGQWRKVRRGPTEHKGDRARLCSQSELSVSRTGQWEAGRVSTLTRRPWCLTCAVQAAAVSRDIDHGRRHWHTEHTEQLWVNWDWVSPTLETLLEPRHWHSKRLATGHTRPWVTSRHFP